MDTKSILLNNKLAHASKKFYKSCDQIKLIKQRISDLIGVFTYCEQEINRLSQLSNSEANGNNQSIRNDHNYNLIDPNLVSMNVLDVRNGSNSSGSTSSEYEESIPRRTSKEINCNSKATTHINIFRDQIRQQIESLQCVKTVYFMYAHRKADEITKLQCEIYGEDAVREAYEQAEPDALMPVAATYSTNNNRQFVDDNNAIEFNEADSISLFNQQNSSTSVENSISHRNDSNWSPWNFNQFYPFSVFSSDFTEYTNRENLSNSSQVFEDESFTI